jgi:hypothetical protein
MSWLFSQALVEEYSAANSLDGAPCALWSGTPTQQACSWLGKTMDVCRLSRSGMMFKPLTENHGEELLMSFLEVFPAPTFPVPEKGQASTEKPVRCGGTWAGSLAKFDPASSLWRTHQCLLFEDSTECLETFPRWGSMRDGELWELTTPVHLTSENESGSWPTPQMVDYKGTTSGSKFQQRQAQFATWTDGEDVSGTIYPHPDFYDALMGWPTEWSALSALETDKFQQWLRSHGEF